MKSLRSLSLVLLISYGFSPLHSAHSQSLSPAPSVTTELPGHRPGGTVRIAGTGFQPDEAIVIQVLSEPVQNHPAQLYDPFLLAADGTGTVAGEWRIPFNGHPNTTLHLVASGQSSGRNAATSFMVGAAIKAAKLSESGGEEIQISGGGFEPGEKVTVEVVLSEPSEGISLDYPNSVVVADADGALRASLPLSSEAGGSFQILATREPMVAAAASSETQLAEPCPLFLTATVYAAGQNPYSVAADDFNQDGKVDLAVANSQGGSVSVLLNNGDGTFQTRVPYGTASNPIFVRAGDLNGDGKSDLAVANATSGSVSVLRGNGDGTFGTAVNCNVGSEPAFVGAGDFDANGSLDLVVANSGSGNISVLLGNGNGTFQTRVNYPVGSTPRSAAIADFNADGWLDIVVANYGAVNATVLRGKGDGSFQIVPGPTTGYAYSAAVGDFDSDGRLDIAMANMGSSSISVLRGNGDCTFNLRVIYSTTSSPAALITLDFDRDGILDLAAAHSRSAGVVSLLRGIGNGGFEPPQSYPAGGSLSRSLAAADFNGDGKVDLAVANSSSATVSVLAGNTCAAPNLPPVAQCKNVTVFSGAECAVNASIDDGSFDPEGEAIVLTQNPPGPYAAGVTEVTLTVTDILGEVDSCTATVTVIDNTPPAITPPSDVLVVSDVGSCDATEVNLGQPAATDNCVVADLSNDHPSSTFPLGTTLVTWTAVDPSGNTATCIQKVTVISSIRVSLLPPTDKPLKVHSNRTLPFKAGLVNCSGEMVTSGVTLWLRVNSAGSNDPQEILETANGIGVDGTQTSDGAMVLNDAVYQFNLNTGNFNGSGIYTVTVIGIDNATGAILGTAQTTLEVINSKAR